SGAIEPLREDENFINTLMSFTNPVLGVLAGLLITAVIQSASAAVGILQALAMTGAVEFDMAFPIIMGIGIGASVPVMLSALGASTNGKRTAFVYLIIDVLGAVIVGSLFYIVNAIVGFSFMHQTMNMVSIAFVNTMYRLATVIVLAPAIGALEKIVCKLFPEGEEAAAEQADMDRLETRFLQHPALALAQSKTVIDSMAEKTLESVEEAVSVRQTYSKAGLKKVIDLEGVIDRYEDKLGTYIFKITSYNPNEDQSKDINKYLRVLSDFERISDHARNIGEAATEIHEKKVAFSEQASAEMKVLEDAVKEITEMTINAFINNDAVAALRIDPLEEVIDDLCDDIKTHHIERVSRQECTLENGFVFNDLLTDYERISDHCSNVAVDIIEAGNDALEAHEYHMSEDFRTNEVFKGFFNEYKTKYAL
ncbi:MAG: Na/Pi cotransporter family protein, partial [Mogibacterium sp.]|nr:Na/Pi cotransporter family protein [Mogibacterium sp.]